MIEEELSIYDLVKSISPCMVLSISEQRIELYDNTPNYEYEGYMFSIDKKYFNDIKPISITHDILAKNGWERKNGVMVFKNDVIRLGWKEDGTLIFGYYEWPIKVNYIHQLQHILRDVGLIEYANSMRV